ncbi:hypothetical protein [Nocardia sp. NRRL S-836]|uniref:hypothetical protein n=1 Tax=Nocardia sp. NRRL S-836 TaxID=1519492 RepID=UPI0006AF6024|nr:hypothetical protein [Nocardia sp. NRRL S-836]KOV84715.1 hypothetical protein ADL03_15710 [Nocardia sp. NRRL S-836]
MTSYDEQKWREHSVEAGCRAAEDLVASKHVAVAGHQVLAAIGFVLVVFTTSGLLGEPVLLRHVLTLLGGVAIGFGLDMVGRARGQRQIVQLWRKSLERPMPTDDDPAV